MEFKKMFLGAVTGSSMGTLMGGLGGPVGIAVGATLALKPDLIKDAKDSLCNYYNKYKLPFDEKSFPFAFNLASYALNVDGLTKEEKDEIEEILKIYESKYSDSKINFSELKKRILKPVSFDKLKRMFKSSDKTIVDKYRVLLKQMVDADGETTKEEEIFIFKCELMFKNLTDISIFKICENDKPKGIINELITFITETEALERFSFTGDLSYDIVYMPHMEDKNLLISIKYLLEDFIKDKMSEVINAMRFAGAKSLSIQKGSNIKTEKTINSNIGTSVSTPVSDKILNAKGEFEFNNKQFDNLEKEEELYCEFDVSTAMPDANIDPALYLERTTFLKNDAKMQELFNSRFSKNRISKYSYKIEEKSTKEISTTINLCIGGANTKREPNSDVVEEQKIIEADNAISDAISSLLDFKINTSFEKNSNSDENKAYKIDVDFY